jgi:hypothetical protein
LHGANVPQSSLTVRMVWEYIELVVLFCKKTLNVRVCFAFACARVVCVALCFCCVGIRLCRGRKRCGGSGCQCVSASVCRGYVLDVRRVRTRVLGLLGA